MNPTKNERIDPAQNQSVGRQTRNPAQTDDHDPVVDFGRYSLPLEVLQELKRYPWCPQMG
jgi:hypothetical protein